MVVLPGAPFTNGGVYSTVTTATMNLTSAPNTMDTYQYRCIVSGTCTPAATSSAATLNFNVVPSITIGPSSATICPEMATLLSGLPLPEQALPINGRKAPMAVRYGIHLSNTGVYSTVTTATMNLSSAPNSMNTYQYRCVVSGACTPAATSAAATLNFNIVPSVTTGPFFCYDLSKRKHFLSGSLPCRNRPYLPMAGKRQWRYRMEYP